MYQKFIIFYIYLWKILSNQFSPHFYVDKFRFNSFQTTHFKKIVPHFDNPIFNTAIIGIDTSQQFGFSMTKSIANIRNNQDQININATFYHLASKRILLNVYITIFQNFYAVQFFQLNLTNDQTLINSLAQYELNDTKIALFLTGFQTSNNNFSYIINSSLINFNYYQHKIYTLYTQGWVTVGIIIISDFLFDICNIVVNTKINIMNPVYLTFTNESQLLNVYGIKRSGRNVLNFSISQYTNRGNYSVQILQLIPGDISAVMSQLTYNNITKTQQKPIKSRYQLLNKIFLSLNIIFILILIIYCIWNQEKQRINKTNEFQFNNNIVSENKIMEVPQTQQIIISCVICKSNLPDTIIEPCKHRQFCSSCILKLEEKQKKCPICFTQIANIRNF